MSATFTIVDLVEYDTDRCAELEQGVALMEPNQYPFYTFSKDYITSLQSEGSLIEMYTVTLDEILAEINRDRSDEWLDYDRDDWEEGMYEFTYWRLVMD